MDLPKALLDSPDPTLADPASATLAWLQLGTSFAGILAACSMIVVLLMLLWRRRDLEFRWLVRLFALAVLAASIVPAVTGWSIGAPDPWLDAYARAAAAGLALIAATGLWLTLPAALHLPSPGELRRLNAGLQKDSAVRQQALRAAEDKAALYGAVFAKAGTGLALVTPDGRWVDVNRRFGEVMNIPSADIRKRTLTGVLGPGGPAPERPSGQLEREISGPGGARQIELSWSPLTAPDGHTLALVMRADDVTEHREREQALARLRKEADARSDEKEQALVQTAGKLEDAEAMQRGVLVQLKRLSERLTRSSERLGALEPQLERPRQPSSPATTLPTAYGFAERLEDAVGLARRHALPLTLLLIAADATEKASPGASEVLLQLRGDVRSTDAIGQIDDQRLGIALPHTGAHQALRAVERLRRRLADHDQSACFGVAELRPGMEIAALAQSATEALQMARATGRNSIAHSQTPQAARS